MYVHKIYNNVGTSNYLLLLLIYFIFVYDKCTAVSYNNFISYYLLLIEVNFQITHLFLFPSHYHLKTCKILTTLSFLASK